MEENCILLPYLGKKPQQQKIQIHIVDINFVECITSRVKLNILFIYFFFYIWNGFAEFCKKDHDVHVCRKTSYGILFIS